jgi:hypothetical protein
MSEFGKSKRYWFPAKKYGWGWGWPSTWEGHVVMVSFFALSFAGVWLFNPESNPIGFTSYVFSLTAVLIFICYRKGEPPSWRWGK